MFPTLVSYFLRKFNDEGENALQSICNCKVPSEVVLMEYKKLKPIENLSKAEKLDLWEYAKEKYPNGDEETRIRFTKIVYTIGNLI